MGMGAGGGGVIGAHIRRGDACAASVGYRTPCQPLEAYLVEIEKMAARYGATQVPAPPHKGRCGCTRLRGRSNAHRQHVSRFRVALVLGGGINAIFDVVFEGGCVSWCGRIRRSRI